MQIDQVPVSVVSVITPVFNGEKWIKRCVESVQSQGPVVGEHIVVNDGSTDSTLKILQELEHIYDRLMVVNIDNHGAGFARNVAIKLAKFQYIAFLDSDDFWLPKKTETQVGFMRANNSAFSYMEYFKQKASKSQRTIVSSEMTLCYNDLLYGSCGIGCLTVMFDIHKIGKIEMPLQRRGQDWGYWLLLMQSAGVAKRAPGCLSVYNDQKGTLSKNKIKKLLNIYSIYRSIARFGLVRALLATFRHALGAVINGK